MSSRDRRAAASIRFAAKRNKQNVKMVHKPMRNAHKRQPTRQWRGLATRAWRTVRCQTIRTTHSYSSRCTGIQDEVTSALPVPLGWSAPYNAQRAPQHPTTHDPRARRSTDDAGRTREHTSHSATPATASIAIPIGKFRVASVNAAYRTPNPHRRQHPYL